MGGSGGLGDWKVREQVGVGGLGGQKVRGQGDRGDSGRWAVGGVKCPTKFFQVFPAFYIGEFFSKFYIGGFPLSLHKVLHSIP